MKESSPVRSSKESRDSNKTEIEIPIILEGLLDFRISFEQEWRERPQMSMVFFRRKL